MGELITINDLKVTKANDLVEASYKLTLNEQRLLLMAIAHIDSRKPLIKKYYFRISALDFAETFGLEKHTAYVGLEDAANRLLERIVQTYNRKSQVRERFHWVFHVKYYDGEGFVDLGFSPNVIPYLTLLSQRFTSYELQHITRLNSSYAIRLYELLKQFVQTGERVIPLERFKERLELADLYPRFFDLKRRVIQPAVNEINAYTDLEVKWDTVRKGRKVMSLMFTFNETKQTKLSF
jgi:plasmid replication initiation protein